MDFTDTRLGVFLGLWASPLSADLFLLPELLVKADIALSEQKGGWKAERGVFDALDTDSLGELVALKRNVYRPRNLEGLD